MSLRVDPGQIVSIVGDNGAGKSTFIKCLTGIYTANSGTLAFRGEDVTVSSPDHARDLGIETVYQDLGLVDELPVWHNLHLNRELTWGRGPFAMLRRKAMSRNAAKMLAELDVRIPSPDIEISALSDGQRQAVAISRAVSWGPSLVIMDEPTAALGVRETAAVEQLILRLRDRGTSVILISHDMSQVLRVSDSVTVLRHGRTVSSRAASLLTPDIALITGRQNRKGDLRMTAHFNHMGLTVSSLERSLHFYCGELGLPRPPEGHVFPIEGQWLGELVGADDPRIQVAFVPLDHGILELLEYQRPGTGKSEASLRNWDVGSAHLALNVIGLAAFYEERKDRLPFLSAPQVVESGPWGGGLVVYLRDPDGNPVELVDAE